MSEISDRAWMGREFLTWLWFKCEVEGGEFEIPSGRLDLIIEDNLVLVGHHDEDSVSQVKGGCPTLRPESASALASGMMARRARLHAARDEREWTFTLDGEGLDLRGTKLPAVEAEDPLEQLLERLEAAEEIREAVEELFKEFLTVRLGRVWDEVEAKRMRDWVKSKLDRSDALQHRDPASVKPRIEATTMLDDEDDEDAEEAVGAAVGLDDESLEEDD